MTHNAEDAAELIERLDPDEQKQVLEIMRHMVSGKDGVPERHLISMDEMRFELEGLTAVSELLLVALEEDCSQLDGTETHRAAQIILANRTNRIHRPALEHIFGCMQDLYRRADEATA